MSSVQSASGDNHGGGTVGWRSILLTSLAACALAFALMWLATPHYRAETRLLIEPRETSSPRATTAADRPVGDPVVASQVDLVLSTELLNRVVKELGLAGLPEFDEAAAPSYPSQLLVSAGLRSDPNEIPLEDRVLRVLRDKLSVYRVERSRMIVIEMSSQDPRLAAAIPNALAVAYVDMQADAARQSNSDVAALLELEIAELSKQVEEAEARVARFRSQWDLFINRDDSGQAAQQLSELSSELTRIRAARAEAEARAEQVEAALEGEGVFVSLPGVPSSPVFQTLRETRAELQTQLADLSATMLDDHPRVRALRSRLDDIEARLRLEAENVARGLRSEAAAAHARERRIAADLDRLKAEAAQAGEKEVELRAMERDAAVQRELLTSHLARYSEATARRAGTFLPAGVRIVSRAIVPSDPYFPRMLPIAAAAFAGSVLVMAMWSLLRRSLSRSATQSAAAARMEPIEEVMVPAHGDGAATDVRPERLPVSSMIFAPGGQEEPRAASGLGEIDIHRAADMLIASGAVRALFVSPEGDDAAAAAVLVAREIADAGLRVLLLDLTTAGAASQPMLDSVSYPGITNLLASEAQFTDVIHQDHYSNCHVIPVGTAEPSRAMRAADRLPIIMESLTTAYDMVLVECGPADADGIRRLVAEGTEILVSVIEPDSGVTEAAEMLHARGYAGLTLVTPVGYRSPNDPVPDRSAA